MFATYVHRNTATTAQVINDLMLVCSGPSDKTKMSVNCVSLSYSGGASSFALVEGKLVSGVMSAQVCADDWTLAGGGLRLYGVRGGVAVPNRFVLVPNALRSFYAYTVNVRTQSNYLMLYTALDSGLVRGCGIFLVDLIAGGQKAIFLSSEGDAQFLGGMTNPACQVQSVYGKLSSDTELDVSGSVIRRGAVLSVSQDGHPIGTIKDLIHISGSELTTGSLVTNALTVYTMFQFGDLLCGIKQA